MDKYIWGVIFCFVPGFVVWLLIWGLMGECVLGLLVGTAVFGLGLQVCFGKEAWCTQYKK